MAMLVITRGYVFEAWPCFWGPFPPRGLGHLHLTSTEPCTYGTYERWKSKDELDDVTVTYVEWRFKHWTDGISWDLKCFFFMGSKTGIWMGYPPVLRNIWNIDEDGPFRSMISYQVVFVLGDPWEDDKKTRWIVVTQPRNDYITVCYWKWLIYVMLRFTY